METNEYLIEIKNFVELNTPVSFNYDLNKYLEAMNKLTNMNIEREKRVLISASYCLFYTAINYHKLASQSSNFQPYNILLGDYISSYITEILYTNKMIKILKIFTNNAKEIMLNKIININKDNLLEELISNID